MPEISVVMDNYNYAGFLPQAIESVLSQTFTGFELIIVDDGSKDNSQDIVIEYAEKDTRIIPVFKENGGQTSAFNAGVSKAAGKIIAFLDSDDYWYPRKLERIVSAHDTHDIVSHWISPNGNAVYRRVNTAVDWTIPLTRYGYMFNHTPTSGLSFSKTLLEEFFPLSDEQEMRGYADGCILMLAMTHAKIGFIDEILAFYRIHDRNLNVNATDSGSAAYGVLQRQRDYVNKQLAGRRRMLIPFSNHAYFEYLLRSADGVPGTNAPVVVYGTGLSGLFMLEVLRKLNVPVFAFGDSFVRESTEYLGLPVYNAARLWKLRRGFGKVIIASSAQLAIHNALSDAGFGGDSIVNLPI